MEAHKKFISITNEKSIMNDKENLTEKIRMIYHKKSPFPDYKKSFYCQVSHFNLSNLYTSARCLLCVEKYLPKSTYYPCDKMIVITTILILIINATKLLFNTEQCS